jgi:urease beta subunit
VGRLNGLNSSAELDRPQAGGYKFQIVPKTSVREFPQTLVISLQ